MNTHPVAKPNSVVKLGTVEIGNARKLSIIAGPCQLESRAHAFDMAGALKEACGKLGVDTVLLNTRLATAQLNARAQPWIWGRPEPKHRAYRRRFIYTL